MKSWAFIIVGLAVVLAPFVPAEVTIPLPWDVVTPVVTVKADAAVYVYEKDSTAVPSGVMAGINRLNREKGIVATLFEDDTTDGEGDVPEQYREPLRAAREAGLPAFVVMGSGRVLKVSKVDTAEQVMEAVP